MNRWGFRASEEKYDLSMPSLAMRMKKLLAKWLRRQALERDKHVGLWRRLGRPSLEDWAEYLRRHGGFRAFGENCAMSPDNHFGNPALISIGNNVRIAGAWMSCHDGSVNMVNRARGLRLDSVGKIEIGDNVFIGYGAKIMPNVTIGSDVIVALGAVVTRDVESGTVVAGVPARKISDMDTHIVKLQERTDAYPWSELIKAREGGYDPRMEPELTRLRVKYFYPDSGTT